MRSLRYNSQVGPFGARHPPTMGPLPGAGSPRPAGPRGCHIPGEPMPASPVLFRPSSLRGALARGVLVGGVAAIGWAVARRFADDGDLRLLDWETATRVAIRVGGADGGISFTDR